MLLGGEMSKENRRSRRLPTTILADIFDAGTLELQGKGCVFNMSKTGAAFESKLKLDKNKSIFVRLNVPMEILGEVVRIETSGEDLYRYGIKFAKLTMSDAIKFKDIIFENLEEVKSEDIDNILHKNQERKE